MGFTRLFSQGKRPYGNGFALRALCPLLGLVLALPFAAGALPLPARAQTGAPERQAVKSPLAAKSLIIAVAEAGRRLVAVGERGHIILSDDKGRTWRQAEVVPRHTSLTAVAFADSTHGWAAGHAGTVLYTEDGGETWTVQREAKDETILTLLFLDRSRGFAGGADGLFLETSDGGASWKRRAIAGDEQSGVSFNGLFLGPGQSLFMAGGSGLVLRSLDLGQTFETIGTGHDGTFWGGLALGDDSLLVFGPGGEIRRSSDMGGRWRKIESGTRQALSSGVELIDGTVVLAGHGGVVLTSSDAGRSFKVEILAGRKALSAAASGAGGEVNLFGEGGVARHGVPARLQ